MLTSKPTPNQKKRQSNQQLADPSRENNRCPVVFGCFCADSTTALALVIAFILERNSKDGRG
ncbi:hypothetical protein ACUY2E_01960 [Corynebacterium confusum]